MRGLECPFSGDIKVPETTISSCYELREIDRLYKTIRRLTSGLPVAPRKLLSPRSFAVSSLIIKERENATRRIRQSFKTSLGFSVRFNPSPTERCFICHQKKKICIWTLSGIRTHFVMACTKKSRQYPQKTLC